MQGQTRLLTPVQAADFLGLKNPDTLSVWRATKRYPLKYKKVGRLIRYSLEDLEKFLEARTVGDADQQIA